MQRFAYRALAVSVALATASLAQAADLLSVYQEAKKYDATFAAAEAAHVAGQEKLDQARSLWLPHVTLQAGYNHVTQSSDTSNLSAAAAAAASSSGASGTGASGLSSADVGGGSLSGNTRNYQATVTQPLYDASASVGSEQLREQARLADVTFAGARQSLIQRVAKAYFDVLYAQDSVEYVKAQKEAVAQQLAQAKKSFEVGVSTITDTHEAQASYDAIIASEIQTQNDLLVNQNAFLQLTGVPGDGIVPLATKILAVPPEPNDVNVWLKRAEDNSLDIAGQRSNLAVAVAEIDKYRAIRQPTLALQGQYGSTWTNGSLGAYGGSHSTQSTIGVGLTIPLYTGGNTSSKLRETLALRDQAQSQLEATRRAVAQTTKSAFLGVKSGAAQIKALEQALVSAQSSLDSTSLGREVGVRTTLDVLNAEEKVYSTKRDLARARYDYLTNKLNLSAAVGDLNESNLNEINAQLKH